ncbi:tRNA (adenosine(37)-N6)-threonylcarbamoyltransferase complex ATPase subunit type 1 TsaE [sulfur-oxidizing endosymbiont of Gigantopelta aegis]|uniref:tRNA (adenosine(37)-N6)-threonylcarbamoyltransferase complex ATPase subunit type 1 TsaE n=1 Tax=sulfur-oxidizing endosymbiont of Gigantopelta aegis TaxID=2794934 RepID=UPI003CCE4BB5
MIGLGSQLAKAIIPGVILYLDGDLGAGKTTLVRGFLRALGHEGAVKSPTFTVVEPYMLENDILENNLIYNYNELEGEAKVEHTNVFQSSISKNSISQNSIFQNNIAQKIYHFDLYRLNDPEELEYLGIRDYLDGQAIALIEWPEKGYGVLPRADITIKITHLSQGRKVELLSQSDIGAAIVAKLISNDSPVEE